MTNERHDCIDRRRLLQLGAASMAMAAGAGLPMRAFAGPDPSLGIPSVTLNWGSLPFTNHAWHVLASRLGYLADVGITMAGGEQPGTPRIVNERQVIPQLENQELDVSGHYFGGIVQALDRLPDARVFLSYGFAQGRAILCAPDSGFKTVRELLEEGKSWDEATAEAIAQMRGRKLGMLNEPSARPFIEFCLSTGGLTLDDIETVPLEDPRTVQLALGGQLDFAAPSGFVQVYQLQQQAGWKPLIDQPLLMSSLPTGRERLSEYLNYDLIMCTAGFLEANRDTILRTCSAMYRTLDAMFGPDQMEVLSDYAPFINSITGASIDVDAIKYIFEDLDPFLDFDAQAQFWEDESSPLYYRTVVDPQIVRLIADGVLPDQDYDLDTVFASKGIWQEMRDLKARTEELAAQFDPDSGAEAQALYDAAMQHHGWRNYLDSARLMQLALG